MIAQPVTVRLADGQSGRGCTCLQQWAPAYAGEFSRRRPGRRIRPTQWCYSGGAVSASGPTHDGGGAWDIDIESTDGTAVTAADWSAADDLAEEMGAVSYWRDYRDGMADHEHQLLMGCPHLDPAAADQIDSWLAYRNGLISNAPDRDTTRPAPIRTWSQGITYITQGDLAMADITTINAKLDTIMTKIGYDTTVDLRTQQSQLIDEAVSKVTQTRVNALMNTLPEAVVQLAAKLDAVAAKLDALIEARQ